MRKVSIIGSGNVGVSTAFYLAEKGVADIMLIDNAEGKAKGSALDLAEASPLRNYELKIDGSSDFKDLKDSQVVVITAGKVRKLNSLRLELLEENLKVMDSFIGEIKENAPNAIVIVVTEPVSTLTYYVWKRLGFDRFKVMGLAGLLDTTRVCQAVAEELDVTPVEVSAIVLGGHHEFMVIPKEFIRVSGIPVSELLPKETIKKIITETREAGSTVLSLLKRETSMYTPGAAVSEMVTSILNDTKSIVCVSTCLDGEYDYKNICLSIPVELGMNGIEKVIQVELPLDVQEELKTSANIIKKAIDSLGV